ncbi:hypothetical protein D3C81_1887690 [compost metagenome]
MVCPKREKLVEISVTDNPVIHTALVAMNKASIKLKGACNVVLGSINNTVPINISAKKLITNKMVGLK